MCGNIDNTENLFRMSRLEDLDVRCFMLRTEALDRITLHMVYHKSGITVSYNERWNVPPLLAYKCIQSKHQNTVGE